MPCYSLENHCPKILRSGNFYVWLSSNFEKSCEQKSSKVGICGFDPLIKKLSEVGIHAVVLQQNQSAYLVSFRFCFSASTLEICFHGTCYFLTQTEEQCSLCICKNSCFCIILFLKFFFSFNTQQKIFFFLSIFLE